MTSAFFVRTTPRFDRLFRALAKRHPDLPGQFATALTILQSDPHNRTRTHNIKKLVGIPEGEGQYRLRIQRWRFRYDITDSAEDPKKAGTLMRTSCSTLLHSS